jgi:hypothetical protein
MRPLNQLEPTTQEHNVANKTHTTQKGPTINHLLNFPCYGSLPSYPSNRYLLESKEATHFLFLFFFRTFESKEAER